MRFKKIWSSLFFKVTPFNISPRKLLVIQNRTWNQRCLEYMWEGCCKMLSKSICYWRFPSIFLSGSRRSCERWLKIFYRIYYIGYFIYKISCIIPEAPATKAVKNFILLFNNIEIIIEIYPEDVGYLRKLRAYFIRYFRARAPLDAL